MSTSLLCVNQDGMDQAKFKTPRCREQPSKMFLKLFRPVLHVAGTWLHGKRLYFAISDMDLPKDSETQCEQLARALSAVCNEHGRLPLGLAVQQDNTYREGKNRHFLGFVILLVALKALRWVSANYLRVGHRY